MLGVISVGKIKDACKFHFKLIEDSREYLYELLAFQRRFSYEQLYSGEVVMPTYVICPLKFIVSD